MPRWTRRTCAQPRALGWPHQERARQTRLATPTKTISNNQLRHGRPRTAASGTSFAHWSLLPGFPGGAAVTSLPVTGAHVGGSASTRDRCSFLSLRYVRPRARPLPPAGPPLWESRRSFAGSAASTRPSLSTAWKRR